MSMTCSAEFDATRKYRYRLDRDWTGDASRGRVAWIMLNPSTADEQQDDPTIRRCVGFSKAWGYGRLTILNLFALRSTDPSKLRDAADPIGPRNDATILSAIAGADIVVAAWGNTHLKLGAGCNARHVRMLTLLDAVNHLGLTKDGQPRHPLYLRGDLKPMWWNRGDGR